MTGFPEVSSPILGRRNRYRKFKHSGVAARVGDSVYICDNADDFSLEHCQIARLYKIKIGNESTGEVLAAVQYFLRPDDLPDEIPLGLLHPDFDLILDERGRYHLVNVEHIISQCAVVEASPEDDFDAIVNADGLTNYICRYRLVKERTLEPMKTSAMLRSDRIEKHACLQEVGNYRQPRVLVSPKDVEDYQKRASLRRNTIEEKSASSDEENALGITRVSRRRNKAASARRFPRKSMGYHNYLDSTDLSDAESSGLNSPKGPTRYSSAEAAEDSASADSQQEDKRRTGQSSAKLHSAVHPQLEEEPNEVGLAKTRARRSAAKPLYVEFSSADDSQVEDEPMKGSWTSEISEQGDPNLKTPIKMSLKRVKSCDLARSASRAANAKNTESNVSPQKSPKRQKDESDSDLGRSRARKALRMRSPIPEETLASAASPVNTPRSRSRRGTGASAEDTGASAVTAISSRQESGLSFKRLQVSVQAMIRAGKSSDEEDSGAIARRGRKPSQAKVTSDDREEERALMSTPGSVTRKSRRLSERVPVGAATPRRSGRFAPADVPAVVPTDVPADVRDDFLPKGKLTRLPRTPKTPKSSKRTTTSSAREVDDVGGVSALEDGDATPKTSKTPRKTPSRTPRKTPAKALRNMTPAMPERSSSIPGASSSMDVVRANLHVSAVPNSMPCREREFENIYTFVGKSISESVGGAMFISGLPGSGKTATVHAVMRQLQQHVDDKLLPPFQFVEVNGLRLTEPRQVFVRILQELTGEKYTAQQAEGILEKKFMAKTGLKKSIVLLVDEIDMLRSRKQEIIYKLFEWPRYARSALVVLGIANTMDLPERVLAGKVNSRFGFTRLSFKAYEYKQLQEIVTARLQGSDCFNPDAVQLVARKVAAVSGDARRALDICRRATELVAGEKDCVTLAVVDRALKQMMNSVGVKALKACSRMEKMFLQAIVAEIKRTGVEDTTFSSVYRQLKSICNFNRLPVPDVSEALAIVSKLGSSRIIRNEHGKAGIMQTITLDVSSDDIHYAITSVAA